MRKLLVLMLVLGLTTAANAVLKISVNGVVDPPDSQINLYVSDTINIDIYGDDRPGEDGGLWYMGILTSSTGAGSLNIDNVVIHYSGSNGSVAWLDDEEIAEILGVYNPFLEIEFIDLKMPGEPTVPLSGVLADNIIFHCDNIGDVWLVLFDGDGNVDDAMLIHQIPEPMTLVLLGLGGLFLRRR